MITVNEVLKAYASENNITPTANDKKGIGFMVTEVFNKTWVPSQYSAVLGGTIIPDTHLMYIIEDGYSFVVKAYPDEFQADILKCVIFFYKKKGQNLEADRKANKKTAPKPVQPPSPFKSPTRNTVESSDRKPVFSGRYTGRK